MANEQVGADEDAEDDWDGIVDGAGDGESGEDAEGEGRDADLAEWLEWVELTRHGLLLYLLRAGYFCFLLGVSGLS